MNFVLCAYDLDSKGEEYLKACIASIVCNCPDDHIYVIYKDISIDLIKEISRKYNINFVEYPYILSGYQHIAFKLSMNDWFLEGYQQLIDICFLDIDCLVLKPVREVFDHNFDISIIYKDPCVNTKYRVPFNCGVTFLQNNQKVRYLYNQMRSNVNAINCSDSMVKIAEKFGGGLHQFVFLYMLYYIKHNYKLLELMGPIYNLHIDWQQYDEHTKIFHHKGGVWKSIIFDRKIRPKLEFGYLIWKEYRDLYGKK